MGAASATRRIVRPRIHAAVRKLNMIDDSENAFFASDVSETSASATVCDTVTTMSSTVCPVEKVRT